MEKVIDVLKDDLASLKQFSFQEIDIDGKIQYQERVDWGIVGKGRWRHALFIPRYFDD